jgi:putative ABC transport system substrate-binding protein
MKRREFIKALGGAAAAWSHAASAQPKTMLRIGMATIQPKEFWAPFEARMRELGYVEGHDFIIENLRVSSPAQFPEAMTNLVGRRVDILMATGPEESLKAAMAATDKLPIVMIAIDYDPVTLGYVSSLARPAGNVTGIFFEQIELSAKRLQLAKEMLPDLQSAAVFWDRSSSDQLKSIMSAGHALDFPLFAAELTDQPYNYEVAWASIPPDYRGALLLTTSPIFFRDREQIARFTVRQRLPTMFVFREWVQAGGLVSYGASIQGLLRRAADYVVRLAKGARPADLPIEQPTKFELVVNLKTARAIGITLPTSILLRADELIE